MLYENGVYAIVKGHYLMAYIVNCSVDELLCRHQSLDVAVHYKRKAGTYLLDAWCEAQAYLVTQILGRFV